MIRVLWFAPDAASISTIELEKPADIYLLPVQSRAEIFSYLESGGYDVVLGCLPMPELTADELISEAHRINAALPVVIWQMEASIDEAIRLTKLGAYHVVSAPAPPAKLFDTLRSAASLSQGQRALKAADTDGEPWRKFLIGGSKPMERVAEVIRLVAARRSTVLITGETGTGKELVARAIHTASGRAQSAMVSVNCAAIPENLLEAELFGHVKGAFTGAVQTRIGRFEQANGSTIFLDEIGELPLELQAKLLRVLQEKEIQRLGSSDTIRLNVRVVAATNASLEQAVQEKRFRQDLYYRLNVVPLRLPPLRERKSDVPLLVQHFIQKICTGEGIPFKNVSSETLLRLANFDWPGNVRQLEHAVEMAVVLSGTRSTLYTADFALGGEPAENGRPETPLFHVPDDGLDFDDTVSRVERAILQQALLKSNGNKARAAELLRMKRTTLLAKLKTLEFPSGRPAVLEAVCA